MKQGFKRWFVWITIDINTDTVGMVGIGTVIRTITPVCARASISVCSISLPWTWTWTWNWYVCMIVMINFDWWAEFAGGCEFDLGCLGTLNEGWDHACRWRWRGGLVLQSLNPMPMGMGMGTGSGGGGHSHTHTQYPALPLPLPLLLITGWTKCACTEFLVESSSMGPPTLLPCIASKAGKASTRMLCFSGRLLFIFLPLPSHINAY